MHVKTGLKSLLVCSNEQMSFYKTISLSSTRVYVFLYIYRAAIYFTSPYQSPVLGKLADSADSSLQPALAHVLISAMSHKSVKSNRVCIIPGSLYPILNSFFGGRSVPAFTYAHSGMGTALLTPLPSLAAV